jgi:hypothetical protein
MDAAKHHHHCAAIDPANDTAHTNADTSPPSSTLPRHDLAVTTPFA